MASPIARLYRVQLRTARHYDAQPALKTLLALPGTPLIAPAAGARAVPDAVAACVREFTAPSEVYLPPRSLYDFVRRQWGAPLVVSDAGEAAARDARVDVAFNAQRALVYLADLAAALAAAEEHADVPRVPGLEGLALEQADALAPGCLLLEHPSVTRPGRSLIYVYDISQNVAAVHGDEEWAVRGYVVNRPFPTSVQGLLQPPGADGAGGGGGGAQLGAFGQLTAFHGGGHDERLAVLHAHGDVEGAAPVDPDAPDTLYVGGSVEAINAKLASGAAGARDFKALVGCVALRLERGADGALALADADRFAFACGPAVRALALAPPMFDTTGRFRDGHGLGAGDVVAGYNYARFWHQNAAWAAAVRLLADGMDPARGDRAWREVRAWAGLHAGVTHVAQAALPLPCRRHTDAVELVGGGAPPGSAGVAADAG